MSTPPAAADIPAMCADRARRALAAVPHIRRYGDGMPNDGGPPDPWQAGARLIDTYAEQTGRAPIVYGDPAEAPAVLGALLRDLIHHAASLMIYPADLFAVADTAAAKDDTHGPIPPALVHGLWRHVVAFGLDWRHLCAHAERQVYTAWHTLAYPGSQRPEQGARFLPRKGHPLRDLDRVLLNAAHACECRGGCGRPHGSGPYDACATRHEVRRLLVIHAELIGIQEARQAAACLDCHDRARDRTALSSGTDEQPSLFA